MLSQGGDYFECKLEPPEDTEMLSQDGEYIECKSEPPEDTEVPSKGGEYIECKLEPTGDTKMISVKQETLWINTLHNQELGHLLSCPFNNQLNDSPNPRCRNAFRVPKLQGSPPFRYGQICRHDTKVCFHQKGGVRKFSHVPIQSCHKYLFKHKGSERFSYLEESHSIINQKTRHCGDDSVYAAFASRQKKS